MINPKYIQAIELMARVMKDALEANAVREGKEEISNATEVYKPANRQLEEYEDYVNEVLSDKSTYYDFTNRVFDDIRDKIIAKGKEYTRDSNVLTGVYDAAARRVGGIPTRDDVLHTIFLLKDKHDIALLRNGIDCGDIVDRLTDCIVYDLMALYTLEDTGIYRFAGEEDDDEPSERPATRSDG